MKTQKKLTKQAFWEDYWDNKSGTWSKKKTSILVQEIHRKFIQFLPVDNTKNVLEIGGAPGEYLIYMAKELGYKPNSMDYSEIGNRMTKENFDRIGMDIKIYEKDLFSEKSDSTMFDVVYSLGFIEHFEDTNLVVKKHLEYLKPGGILLLGVPNLTGIYGWFLKYLSPSYNSTHNLKSMDIRNWKSFETENKLEPIFNEFIGGFEPIMMKKMDSKTFFNQILLIIVKCLMVVFSLKRTFLRSINSRYWSGYILGIYRKPS